MSMKRGVNRKSRVNMVEPASPYPLALPVENAVERSFGLHQMLPSQMVSPFVRADENERRLWCAVLSDALSAIQNMHSSLIPRFKIQFKEDMKWLSAKDSKPGGALFCCDNLGIDHGALVVRVEQYIKAHEWENIRTILRRSPVIKNWNAA